MMYLKWICSLLGFAYFGIRGAIVGFILGALIDSLTKTNHSSASLKHNGLNSFVKSIVIITAAVMKADGSVIKIELNYVKVFFRQQFGESTAKSAVLYLRDILKQTLPVQQTCAQLRAKVDYGSRIHILHYLFGLAKTKGNIISSELITIESIANGLGISYSDFSSVKSAFIKTARTPQEIHWAYKTLEIQPNATNDEVKKAYRRMAVKYHPDKIGHKGEKEQKTAEEYFKKINNAFEEIKHQRGMS